jgi:hypothetical protein
MVALPPGFSATAPSQPAVAPVRPGAYGNNPMAVNHGNGIPVPAAPWQIPGMNDQPGANERRGELAPVIRNEQTGALRLAWPQMVMDMGLFGDVASGKTPLDPRVPIDQQDPATLDQIGRVAQMFGSDGAMAGRNMIPADGLPQGLVAPSGKAIPSFVQNRIASSGIAPGDVNARIAALGPGAVLADIGQPLQGAAAKLASLPEPAAQTVASALKARQAGATDRVDAALNDIVGPEPVPSAVAAGLAAKKELIGQMYDPLFAKAAPIDPQPVMANLNGAISQAVPGPTQAALLKVQKMFYLPDDLAKAAGSSITTDPARFFQIRQELDPLIQGEENPKVKAALQGVRDNVDAALTKSVPAIKTVDAAYQEHARQQEGFNLGRSALSSGTNVGGAPLHPDDLASAMQQTAMQSSAGPMQWASGVPQQIGAGLVSKMYEIVGSKANDRVALKQIITGDGKWNYQKIASALGQDKADALLGLFQNEAAKAETENLALHGSKTGLLAEGGAGLAKANSPPGFLRSMFNTDFGDAAYRLGSKVTGGAFEAARMARNQEIARTLMGGPNFSTMPMPPRGLFGPRILPPQLTVPVAAQAVTGADDLLRKILSSR